MNFYIFTHLLWVYYELKKNDQGKKLDSLMGIMDSGIAHRCTHDDDDGDGKDGDVVEQHDGHTSANRLTDIKPRLSKQGIR